MVNRSASLLTVLQDFTTLRAVESFLQTNGSLTESDTLHAALLLLQAGKEGLFDEWFLQVTRVRGWGEG